LDRSGGSAFDFGGTITEDMTLYAQWSEATLPGIYGSEFPDPVFRDYVLWLLTWNRGGTKNAGSAISANDKDLLAREGSLSMFGMGIRDYSGLQYFTGLTYFNCTNDQLAELDVSKNVALDTLYCHGNRLRTLDVSNNAALFLLACSDNQLGELDVSKNAQLQGLYCENNRLARLDVSKNTALAYLNVAFNCLESPDDVIGWQANPRLVLEGAFRFFPQAITMPVSILPTLATLSGGDVQLFKATVANAANASVTWSASGGTITQDGLYTAPNGRGVHYIWVTSDENPSKRGWAVAMTDIRVSVSPEQATMVVGSERTFTATVTGSLDGRVTWTATSGTITQDGRYTAPLDPAPVIVRATSVEDPSKSDFARVYVVEAMLTIVDPPSVVAAGYPVTFKAEVIGLEDKSVTWSASSGTMDPETGEYTAAFYDSQTALIMARSVQKPEVFDLFYIRINNLDFDGNSKANPQLLNFANAIGSTLQEDLENFDLNGDGVIDDEDLKILFKAMGW
jgi:hypothetical protein